MEITFFWKSLIFIIYSYGSWLPVRTGTAMAYHRGTTLEVPIVGKKKWLVVDSIGDINQQALEVSTKSGLKHNIYIYILSYNIIQYNII